MIQPRKLAHLVLASMLAAALHNVVAADAKPQQRTAKSSTKSSAKPAKPAKPNAKPAVAASRKQPVTISITSRIRSGNLIVALDGVPIFQEKFEKHPLLISQTTSWDPVMVVTGKHRLTAKVVGANGKSYVSGRYDLEISRKNGIDLRIRMKGNKLTVEPETQSRSLDAGGEIARAPAQTAR